MLKHRDFLIPLSLYLVVLAITVSISLARGVIVSDQQAEWNLYQDTIQTGRWEYLIDNIVNSCLLSTFIPAWLVRITHLPPDFVFWVFPCLFLSLSPMFVYLIARHRLPILLSLLSASLVAVNFYVLVVPYSGRVSVAFGLLPALVWATLGRRLWWGVLLALLLTVSHYATAMVGAVLVLSLVITSFRWRRPFSRSWLRVLVVFIVLVAAVYTWHFRIAGESGRYTTVFVYGVTHYESVVAPSSVAESSIAEPIIKRVPGDPVVELAFHPDFTDRGLVYSLKWLVYWIFTLMVLLGALWSLLWLRREHMALVIITVGALLLSILSPYIGSYYGVGRVWYYVVVACAPSVGLSLRWAGRKFQVGAAVLIVVYALFSLLATG